MKTELVALKGKLYTKSFQLADGQRLVLGRGEGVDIQVLDSGLSRHHCYFEKRGESFLLVDLESRNGTWVNERRITEAELSPGDMVRVGAVEFEFRCGPDRRHAQADLIASVPDKPGEPIKERLNVQRTDLMDLSSPFQNMENYRRMQRDLAAIYEIGNLISAETNLSSLYDRVLEAIFQVVKADRCFLVLPGARGALETVVRRERALPEAAAGASYSKTIVDECFRDRAAILRANANGDDRYANAESVLIQNIHSVLCVPIEASGQALGVIYADTIATSEVFEKHDLELLTAIGKQAGVAIQRVQLSDRVRQMLRGTVRALATAIEAKDVYTRGHSERVTGIALQIGAAMALPDAELRALELAGFLHDVGKIGVPENILRKAGPLTQAEFEIIQQHPRIGAEIISNIEGADEISEIVLHHHERWDGKGYPDAIAGDRPSLLARILGVADAFDAMSSQRPYRDKLAREKVIRTIREYSGTQFDPHVVTAFLKVVEETPAQAPAPPAGA